MKAYVDRFAWEYLGDCPEGQLLLINGKNIWDQKWISTNGKIIEEDPLYHQEHSFSIYIINNDDGTEIKFAACEYSNCYWGFYEYVDRSK
jgi:hypothetical protein